LLDQEIDDFDGTDDSAAAAPTGMSDDDFKTLLGTEIRDALNYIDGKMEELLVKLGPNNPIVSLPMYSHALINMAEAAGFNNAEQYFKPLPVDWKPPAPPMPPSPPAPPPQVIAAQIKAAADKQVAEIRARAEGQRATVDNLVSYLLGVREQDLEAALERYRMARHMGGGGNIGKVKGQMQ